MYSYFFNLPLTPLFFYNIRYYFPKITRKFATIVKNLSKNYT